ncbi:MAG TPA: hypothetical protein VFI79_00310 [Gemmatimonadales bacterium]|nr:hypothetical protein [Gemmatimonadales bacterium]
MNQFLRQPVGEQAERRIGRAILEVQHRNPRRLRLDGSRGRGGSAASDPNNSTNDEEDDRERDGDAADQRNALSPVRCGVPDAGECVADGSGELAGTREAIRRSLGERSFQHALHLCGNRGPNYLQIGDWGMQVLGDEPLRCLGGEGRLAGKHLVYDARERVDVSPAVQTPVPSRLLRAHIGRRADRESGIGQWLGVAANHTRDAEVRYESGAVFGDEEVFRFDVPVNHTVVVRIIQRARGICCDSHRLIEGQLCDSVQPLTERLPVDVRHAEPEMSGGIARFQDRQDVGVLQSRGCRYLAAESVRAEGSCESWFENLDRNRAMVLMVLPEVHGRHAATADLALNRVPVA